jgi:MYXO-CTERM domain-containing protein
MAQAAPPMVRFVPQTGHAGSANVLTSTPDSQHIVSGGADGSIRIREREGFGVVAAFVAHQGRVTGLLVTPDGKRLVTSGRDGFVRVWSLSTFELERTIEAHKTGVHALAGSGDVALVATAGEDGKVRVWDLASGSAMQSFEIANAPARAVALAPDGSWVAAGGDDKVVTLWSVKTGKKQKTLKEPQKDHYGNRETPIYALAVSPDGRLLAAGSSGTLEAGHAFANVWDIASGKVKRSVGFGSPVPRLAFSPDGKRLAMCNVAVTVLVIDDKKAEPLSDEDDVDCDALGYAKDGTMLIASDKLDTWNDKELRLLDRFKPPGDRFSYADAPANLSTVFSASDGRLSHWDLGELRVKRSFPYADRASSVVSSSDGRLVLVLSNGAAQLYDASTGALNKLDAEFKIRSAAFSSDGKRLLLAGPGGDGPAAAVVGVPDGKPQARLDFSASRAAQEVNEDLRFGLEYESVSALVFSGKGDRLLVGTSPEMGIGRAGAARVFDAYSGKLVLEQFGAVESLAFSADGTRFVDSHVALWDSAKDDMKSWVRGIEGSAVAFAPGEQSVLLSLYTGPIVQVGLKDGKQHQVLRGATQGADVLRVSPDGKYAFASSSDGIHRLWRLDNGASVSLVASGDEWLVFTADGYFDASRNGGGLMRAARGLKSFGIEQLAARNNRPDLILERMGLGSKELVAHLKARYFSRLKKLGLDPNAAASSFESAPVAIIDSLQASAQKARLRATLSAEDGELRRLNIFVNGVPVLGSGGKPVKGKRASVDESLTLSAGENKVEVSVLDDHGIESLRAAKTISVDVPRKTAVHFLGFGVSRYQQTRLNLKYAHKDVLDVAHYFQNVKGKAGIGDVHVKVFVDDQATSANVRAAKQYLASTAVDDIVVVMVAGHGTHARDAEAKYYYVTHDTDPANLAKTAVDFEVLEGLLDGIPARRKLFLMDTCESGERDESETQSALVQAGQRAIRARTTRALSFEASDGPAKAAPRRSFLFERERYIYNDITRRTGAVVFSSSSGSEFSYEKDADQNGSFTEELLAAVTGTAADTDKNGELDAEELRRAVAGGVAKRTGDLQHPSVDRDNQLADLWFPVVSGLTFPAVAAGTIPDESEPATRGLTPAQKDPSFARVEPKSSSGCACRVGPGMQPSDAGWGAALLAVAAALIRRRRRG